MSAKMSVSDDFINYYLIDFENSVNTEELNSLETANAELVTCPDNWKPLLDADFDETKLKTFFKDLDEEKQTHYFSFGVACISHFIQRNFTGPTFGQEIGDFLASALFEGVDFAKLLAVNNEEINVNTEFPQLLVAAKAVFNCCLVDYALNLWWTWRATYIHQHILDELSPSLLSQADRIEKDLSKLPLKGVVKARLEIELAQLYVLYRNVTKTTNHIAVACCIIGLKHELIGKLGKRTKYQTEDKAQLALNVTVEATTENIEREQVNDFTLPKNLMLRDDIRLENVQYAEDSICNYEFSDIDQKLLLLIVQEMMNSKPQDDLFHEEIEPFFNMILAQKNTWTTRVATLLIRCKTEEKHNRTIERSLQQCDEILTAIKKDEPHTLNRIGGVFSSGLQPFWRTLAQYADLMLNTGLVKGSLEIYLKLQLWEEVIVCYTLLQMRHKAADIIKQELEKNETVKLWCLLGDATDDVTCYEKAWELSKKRSHRAQRHWGQYYFSHKQYAECIPHFEKSVSINPLQAIVWLRLGFAALETENWQVAATAYRRYTSIEPEGFEGWNNLAQAYLKLNNRRGAHQALIDALRCNFENWKIWENLLVVSADIACYSDTIRAYHKLLDLKGKYLNISVLECLAHGVANNGLDYEGKSTGQYLQKTRELFGRITSIYPCEGKIWDLYAMVAPTLQLKAHRYQRALKFFCQGDWPRDLNKTRQIILSCNRLADIALNDEIEASDIIVGTIRLNMGTIIAGVKKFDLEETREMIKDTQRAFERITEKFNKGKKALFSSTKK